MPLPPQKSVVLVGLMAAGKSTIGRRLATRLGLDFVDSDVEIGRRFGLDVAGIFERFGEARFRECEREIVAQLVGGPARVIAVGGGAFVDDDSRKLILRKCHAVWLEADPHMLAKRIGRGDGRPLLADRDPEVALTELGERRNPEYATAHVRIRSDDAPLDIIVERIAAALAEKPK